MALGQMQYDSYLNNTTQPQENQYLQGNPSTDNQAQTRWMDPNQQTTNTGINGGAVQPGGNNQVSQPTTAPQNGTLLGAVGSGNWMPQGYDQTKWNDPNKHDPKYDIGHILSQYQPGSGGLDQAMNQLSTQGYTRVGKDSIYRPDVGVIDVGKSFGSGDPNQMAWQWLPQDQGGSLTGGQQQNPQQGLLQWIMSLFGGQQPGSNNSTGGYAQPLIRRGGWNSNGNVQMPNQSGPIGGISAGNGFIPNTQYNQYGPGGSNDNITGPAGNYPVQNGPMLPFNSYLNPTFSANYDPRVNTLYGVAQ